jgi:hypothetical protein
MTEKPTYQELEQIIRRLERESLEYLRKEKAFNEERKAIEYSHLRRTISLMKINAELKKEIGERARTDEEEIRHVSHRLRERINELNCLYEISNLRSGENFSFDDVLQAIVDFIPPATQFPEITCARILFDGYDFATENFKDTQWKLSQEIKVNGERIGTLEVCYLQEKPELEDRPFLKEVKNLIKSVAESVAQIVERDWAEIEIRKSRSHIEKLIKNSSRNIAGKT